MRRCFPGELGPATSSCASGRGSCRADPEGSVGGRARAGPPPSLCASRDAREWAWAGRPAAGKPPEHPRRAAPQAESPGAGRERPALPPARPSPAALAPPPSSPRVGKFLESLPSGLCGSNMAELTVEVRGSNGAFYKVRAAGRPGRELGIGSGGRGRRGPRGPRRGGGGGQRVRAAGVCPRRGLTVSGARAPLCLETRRRAPALPAARERRGLRPPGRGRPGGRHGAGVRARRRRPGRAGGADGGGQLTGTPGRPGLRGSCRPRPRRRGGPEAHPGVSPSRGPANPWRPRGERASGGPGCLRPGERAAPRPGRKATCEGGVQR